MTGRAASLVDEWTARALASLQAVNTGVRATLERLHEGEDLVVDEAFGAITAEEKAELDKDKRELEELEKKAEAERHTGGHTEATLGWIHRKAWWER